MLSDPRSHMLYHFQNDPELTKVFKQTFMLLDAQHCLNTFKWYDLAHNPLTKTRVETLFLQTKQILRPSVKWGPPQTGVNKRACICWGGYTDTRDKFSV